jgi:hypothetical protein
LIISKLTDSKSNLYLQYVVSQNNFQDKFVIGWNDLMYYKLVGVNGIGLQTALASIVRAICPFTVDNNINLRGRKYH